MIIQIWKYGSERLKNVYKFKELLLGRSGNQTWCQSLYVSHHITMDLQIHYVVSKLSELFVIYNWPLKNAGVGGAHSLAPMVPYWLIQPTMDGVLLQYVFIEKIIHV